MGKIDLKDKRNVYAIVICLLMMVAAHLVYNYMWDPFTYQREALERDLQSAQAELDKINAKKHRVAELEMQLAQAEKEHYVENRYSIAVNSGYHMLGYLFAEIANFNYPTAITNLRLNRYSGIKAEVEKSETHGWTPITMSVTFNLTTYTSKKVGK